MKTSLMALLCLIFSLTSLRAQNFDIEWGKDFDSNTEVQKILGFSGDELVVYSIKGKKRYFGTYQKESFTQKSFNEFKLPELEGKKSGLLNMALTGDKVTAVLYIYEKKSKAFSLFAQRFDFNGKQVDQPLKLYKSAESQGRIKDMKVEMVFSPNEKKALVYFDRQNKDRTECFSDIIVVDMGGDRLEKVSESAHTFSVKDTKSDRIRYRLHHSVENDGTFSIIREKARFSPTSKASFTMIVGRYDESGVEIGEVELEETHKALLTPTLVVQENKIVVVGYYLDEAHKKSLVIGYSGLFYAELTLDMELEELSIKPFSDEFFGKLFTEKRVRALRGKDRELLVPEAYNMKQIMVHADGSLTVLSEFYRVTVVSSNGSQITTTNYGPILFFKLNSNGDITSGDVIKKQQLSSSKTVGLGSIFAGVSVFVSIEFSDKLVKYWSFASSMEDGKVYLVFNDHFKNALDENGEISKYMRNPKKSVPYLVTINPDGSYEKKAMVSSGDTETYTVPQVTYQNASNEFVIWGIWRKMNKFGQARISN